MSEANNGGPAFPIDPNSSWSCCGGMSLRDYFAAQALTPIGFNLTVEDEQAECADVARLAYLVADAMLAERAK